MRHKNYVVVIDIYKTKNKNINPIIKNHESKSHSGEFVAFGYSNNKIGIDLEVINNKINWSTITKNHFSLKEQQKIKSFQDFLYYWTAKEANFKLSNGKKTFNNLNLEKLQKKNLFNFYLNKYFVLCCCYKK